MTKLFISHSSKDDAFVRDLRVALAARLGELPPIPGTGFIGCNRELLAFQRLVRQDSPARYAVVRARTMNVRPKEDLAFSRLSASIVLEMKHVTGTFQSQL